jgi:hypothetical protein
VYYEVGLRGAHTVPDGVGELCRTCHPVTSRQHWLNRPVGQAVSDRRPLRRRPVTMARPARVRIRNRKPWTLARRRLFGWKVRLPLATAISPRHISGDGYRGHLRSTAAAPVAKLPANRRGPSIRSLPCRPWLGDLAEGTEVTSAGQTALFSSNPSCG